MKVEQLMKSEEKNKGEEESRATARDFFLVITILAGYISLYEIFGGESKLMGARLVLYLGLLGIHLALHWLSVKITEDMEKSGLYVLVQGGLAFSLALVSGSSTISLLMFSSLVAEVIGLIGFSKLSAISIVGLIATALGSFFLIGGQELFAGMWGPSLWTFVILIVFMAMFRKQLESRDESQALLRELEKAYEQLSESSQQIEELTLKSERQRLARELHDSLAQDLSGVVLQLEAIKHLVGSGKTEDIGNIIDEAMAKSQTDSCRYTKSN